ncbi:hypothetical protein NQ317_015188 [Molorchus minor]|uniref:Uncharacterized protein n=1 Tax=Molorchus minor TaxID=1323400 RepID=A0ABQ9K7U8_9CUCU|nr:hypothetical protein NQ317_015188 [Molorchus minor]
MEHDERPLPAIKTRRRSLFENESKEQNRTFTDFPEENCGLYYPEEYIDKVTSEIQQWNMYIEKTLKEKHKFKAEKTELQNTIFNENILTFTQHEFFDSLNIEAYMKRIQEFNDRVKIYLNKIQDKPESETEQLCLTVRKKIEKDLLQQFK